MPFGTFAPSFLKRFGSRMNSTTSRSSSFASSTPATSSQRTELEDEGAISCGFVRGMYWTIQTTAMAIRPMKMIVRQVGARLAQGGAKRVARVGAVQLGRVDDRQLVRTAIDLHLAQ